MLVESIGFFHVLVVCQDEIRDWEALLLLFLLNCVKRVVMTVVWLFWSLHAIDRGMHLELVHVHFALQALERKLHDRNLTIILVLSDLYLALNIQTVNFLQDSRLEFQFLLKRLNLLHLEVIIEKTVHNLMMVVIEGTLVLLLFLESITNIRRFFLLFGWVPRVACGLISPGKEL